MSSAHQVIGRDQAIDAGVDNGNIFSDVFVMSFLEASSATWVCFCIAFDVPVFLNVLDSIFHDL